MYAKPGSRYDFFDVLARAELKGERCEQAHRLVFTGLDNLQMCGQAGSCA